MDSLAHMFDMLAGSMGDKTPLDELETVASTPGPYQAVAQRILASVLELKKENASLKRDLAFAQDALDESRGEKTL